jgi:hypothetical protein
MTEKHPAAKHSDQLAWAIWIGEDMRNSTVFAVTGDSEGKAKERACERADSGNVVHVDGPYQDSEPGVWEFEFITEHRERVVAEGPNEEYASDTAEDERTHKGEYVQTVHKTSRRVKKFDDSE